jgi:hypothetical protein
MTSEGIPSSAANEDNDSDQDQQGRAREQLLKDFQAAPTTTPTPSVKTNKDPPVNNFRKISTQCPR